MIDFSPFKILLLSIFSLRNNLERENQEIEGNINAFNEQLAYISNYPSGRCSHFLFFQSICVFIAG